MEEFVWYIKKKCPQLYRVLKESPCLRYIFFLPNRIYMHRRRKAIQKYGYFIIDSMYHISKDFQIPIWIDGGTLLGYLRERRLMQHDYDIDFALYSMNATDRTQLLDEMKRRGFFLVRGVNDGTTQYVDSFEYKGAIFDLNYYFEADGYSYYYEQDANREHGSRIFKEKQDNKKITYIQGYDIYKTIIKDCGTKDGKFSNGCPCIVPKNVTKRIEELYGVNWKIPIVRNYDWRRDRVLAYMGFQKNIKGWMIK